MDPLCSLDDVQVALGRAFTGSAEAARADTISRQVSATVRAKMRQTISAVDDVEVEVTANAWGEAVLPERPVRSISAVLNGSAEVVASGYAWNADGALLRSYGAWTPWSVLTVTYSHGWAGDHPVIEALAAWVAAKTARVMVRQTTNPDMVRSESVAGYSVSYVDGYVGTATTLDDSELREVRDILRRNRTASPRLASGLWPPRLGLDWVANA